MRNTPGKNSERRAERSAEQAARHASPWLERLARLGYVAEGVVYVVVGALAVGVAVGIGGRTTDERGALEAIGTQPLLGRVLLISVALGLASYALWQLVQAVADPDGEGHDARGIAKRVGHGFRALVRVGLAFTAGRLVLESTGGGSVQDWTALLLAQPFGRVLLTGVGTAIVGYGGNQLYQAYLADFHEYLKLGEMSVEMEKWVTRGGRFGLASRGVAFGIVGLFLVLAAWRYDSSQAQGLGGALQELLRQPFGPWILCVVAFGLAAYGLLMFGVARYRKIAPSRALRGTHHASRSSR